MENNKTLYISFAKLAIKIALSKGFSLEQAKKIVIKKFEQHPNEKLILKSIKNDEFDKKTLITLLNNCVSVCEDFGPDRDYVTLVLILESVNNEKSLKNSKDISTNIVEHFRKEIVRINKDIPAPPIFNVVLESRAIIEWTTMIGLYHLIPKRKKGENKPVLLMPPYLGNDHSTKFVRKYLKAVGFKTYKWDLGVNMINSKYLPQLVERLDEIYEIHQEKVSLVGWSGGGIFAKIIANRYPDKVEQLITIGSPVWGVKNMKTPVIRTLEFLRGRKLRERNAKFIKELEEIPVVPVTCIYTKTDGLVPWKHCMEAETLRNDIQNIEVFGSHIGLGANASVLVSVANTLIKNTHGVEPKGFVSKLENLFFPKFWGRKKMDIVRDLLFTK